MIKITGTVELRESNRRGGYNERLMAGKIIFPDGTEDNLRWQGIEIGRDCNGGHYDTFCHDGRTYRLLDTPPSLRMVRLSDGYVSPQGDAIPWECEVEEI